MLGSRINRCEFSHFFSLSPSFAPIHLFQFQVSTSFFRSFCSAVFSSFFLFSGPCMWVVYCGKIFGATNESRKIRMRSKKERERKTLWYDFLRAYNISEFSHFIGWWNLILALWFVHIHKHPTKSTVRELPSYQMNMNKKIYKLAHATYTYTLYVYIHNERSKCFVLFSLLFQPILTRFAFLWPAKLHITWKQC